MVCVKSLVSLFWGMVVAAAWAVPERVVVDVTAQEPALPTWVAEVASEGQVSETGLALPSDTGVSVRVLREKAPSRLTLTVEGVSAQPLLLNGYEVISGEAGEAVTLCATQLLPFQEAVTLDFSATDWANVSLLTLLPQESATVTRLTFAWDTEDLPETVSAPEGDASAGSGDAASEQTVVWVEASSPSRECPASALRAGEAPVSLMPTDHVTLRAAAFLPFASKTFAVAATTFHTTLTEEGALRFRNDEARVVLGQPAALDFAGERPCAISAWIRPEKKDGLRNIVARGFIPSPKRELFLRFYKGSLQFGWWCNSGQAVASAAYTPALGTWAHVMGVFDGATYILYVNGEEVARKTSNLKPVSFNGDWAIGRHPTTAQRYYYGDIAEVSFYKGNVAPEAVSLLAQSRAQGISEASVRGVWSVGERLIVLADTTPPVLTVPADVALPAPQDDLSIATHGAATATDAASAETIVTPIDEGPAFATQADGTLRYRLLRHWVAEDASGLESVSAQTLDLSDTTPPELTLPADSTVTQRQGIAPAVTGTATATDNSGMEPTVAWRDVADTALGERLTWRHAEAVEVSAGAPNGLPMGGESLLDETRPFTLAAEVCPMAEALGRKGVSEILGKDYASEREVFLRVSDGQVQFGFYTKRQGNTFVGFRLTEADVGRWMALAAVYDGRILRLYRDGVLAAQATPAFRPEAYAAEWRLGAHPSLTDRFFRGSVRRAAL